MATTLRSVRAMAANPEPSACLKGTSPEWPSLPCRLSYRTQGRGLPKAGDCFVSAGTRSRSDRIFVFLRVCSKLRSLTIDKTVVGATTASYCV